MLGEATTSWSFVGAGLRLSAELLGPEYSMRGTRSTPGCKLFFSREVKGHAQGEDLVEKQNAEMGMMPVVPTRRWRTATRRRTATSSARFLGKEKPRLTFDDGVEVVEMLMTAYQSAEEERTLTLPVPDLRTFRPAVARGTWRP